MSLAMPGMARAQSTGTATAIARLEHNSNVYNLDSGSMPPTGNHYGDTYVAYGAAFDMKYFLGSQELYAAAATNQYAYQRFTQLDHNDYDLDAGLRWRLVSPFSGRFEVARRHTMVPFYDSGQSAISVQTVQRELAEAVLKLGPVWQLRSTASAQTTDEPLRNTPNLQLREKSGSASLQYIGFTGVSTGLKVRYSTGDYRGDVNALDQSYRESALEWVARYELSGRSNWDGSLGYTRRSSLRVNDSQSGPTGHLSFNEQLSPKTSVRFEVSRVFVSYLATAGAETDTGANVSIDWRATRKIDVNLSYLYTLRDYPGQGNKPVGSDRLDHQQSLALQVAYQALVRFSVHPYVNLLKRTSDFIGGDFNSNIAGIYVAYVFGGARADYVRH